MKRTQNTEHRTQNTEHKIQNSKFKWLNSALYITLFGVLTFLSSCETQETILTTTDSVNGVADENSALKRTTKQIKWMNRKQSETISQEIASLIGRPIATSKTTTTSIELDFGSVELDKALEIADEAGITNYTYNVIPKNGSTNKFYNLVYTKIGKNKKVKILEYAMTDAFKEDFYKGKQSINQFKGTITEVSLTSLTAKSQDLVDCPRIEMISPGTTQLPLQPVNPYLFDGTSTSGGSGGSAATYSAGSSTVSGAGSIGSSNTLIESCGWEVVEVKCAANNHRPGDDSCPLKGSQRASSYLWNSCTGDTYIAQKNSGTKGTLVDIPCYPGATGIIQPSKAQILKDEFLLTGEQWRFIRGNDAIASSLFNYYFSSNEHALAKAYDLVLLAIMMQNPGLVLDATQSEKSPFNVDTSTITDATPEGAKFNAVYKQLMNSPKFKELFTDLFGSNSKFNVKFEIADHVYGKENPTKEVNGNTDPLSDTSLLIKINAQILTSNGTIPKSKIEIAKTILHECIHAYLFIKNKNLTAGMDITGVINTMYPSPNEQHNFIYTNMLPIMETVLSDVTPLLTSQSRRNEVQVLTMHPTTTPSLTNSPWDWNKYYHYLSLNGLDTCISFKSDFPIDSNQYGLYTQYNSAGHTYLDHN